MNQMIPIPLAQMLGIQPPTDSDDNYLDNLDPQILHTREQMRSLYEVLSAAEDMAKKPDRPETQENGPTVMVTDPHSADSASALIMAASNRLIAIINDDARWKNVPMGFPTSKADRKTASLLAETRVREAQQSLKERAHQHDVQKKIDNAKIDAFVKEIKTKGQTAIQGPGPKQKPEESPTANSEQS